MANISLSSSVAAQVVTCSAPPASSDELHTNLQEIIETLLEDGEPQVESEFVGVQTIRIA